VSNWINAHVAQTRRQTQRVAAFGQHLSLEQLIEKHHPIAGPFNVSAYTGIVRRVDAAKIAR
jgi:hypothetical protein